MAMRKNKCQNQYIHHLPDRESDVCNASMNSRIINILSLLIDNREEEEEDR